MHKNFIRIAAFLGAITVALGAFGAHGLKKMAAPEIVASFETGVRYQFYHIIALLFVGIIYEKFPRKLLRWSGFFFLAGMLLFSGSIYLLTFLKATDKVGLEGIGMITPIGGILLIVGWMLLAFGITKRR